MLIDVNLILNIVIAIMIATFCMKLAKWVIRGMCNHGIVSDNSSISGGSHSMSNNGSCSMFSGGSSRDRSFKVKPDKHMSNKNS